MPRYFTVLTIVIMLGMLLTQVLLMKRGGIEAMNFGKIDKTDFRIPPFALFYFYLVFATVFHCPTVSRQEFFHSVAVGWVGVSFCLAGLILLFWSLVSLGQSFRVGIDTEHPDNLITNGVFAFSRNPILFGIRNHPAWTIPDILQLDISGIYRRGHVAVPPPSNP